MLGLAPAVPVPAPVTRCTVDDPRLAELSGLAVVGADPTEKPTPDGVGVSDTSWALWAMADGGRHIALHRLDPDTCAVVGDRTVAVDPYDAEDLAVAPDGTLWVGDIGDNGRSRTTVAVIVVPAGAAGSGEPVLRRLVYPDGPHDAEALLVGADGVPTVITKELGRAALYRPTEPLDGLGPTPLVHVGDVDLPPSSTAGGPLGGLGSRTVTGAATSVDGTVVALRTYTDAWLFAVPGGDPAGVVAALRGTPVQVPLPDEPQGEALAFTADGTLLSGSESRGGVPGGIRAVPGAAALAAATPPGTAAAPAADPVDPAPIWRPAVIGAGALVALLGLLAAALARRAAGRR